MRCILIQWMITTGAMASSVVHQRWSNEAICMLPTTANGRCVPQNGLAKMWATSPLPRLFHLPMTTGSDTGTKNFWQHSYGSPIQAAVKTFYPRLVQLTGLKLLSLIYLDSSGRVGVIDTADAGSVVAIFFSCFSKLRSAIPKSTSVKRSGIWNPMTDMRRLTANEAGRR